MHPNKQLNPSCYLSLLLFLLIRSHKLLNVTTVIEEYYCFYLQKYQFLNLRLLLNLSVKGILKF